MMALRENLEQGRRWNEKREKLRDGNLAACKSHDARAMAVQAQSEVWALRRGERGRMGWGGRNGTKARGRWQAREQSEVWALRRGGAGADEEERDTTV